MPKNLAMTSATHLSFVNRPADAIAPSGSTLLYPPQTHDLHHEAELVVAIGEGGSNINTTEAPSHIFGFAAGNDLTRQDLQAVAKSQRRPWDMSKGCDDSAIIGPILQRQHMPNDAGNRCLVGAELRQSGHIWQMTWPIVDVIAALSSYVVLAPGDSIMTGTPAGVGPVAPGETCTVEIDG